MHPHWLNGLMSLTPPPFRPCRSVRYFMCYFNYIFSVSGSVMPMEEMIINKEIKKKIFDNDKERNREKDICSR